MWVDIFVGVDSSCTRKWEYLSHHTQNVKRKKDKMESDCMKVWQATKGDRRISSCPSVGS